MCCMRRAVPGSDEIIAANAAAFRSNQLSRMSAVMLLTSGMLLLFVGGCSAQAGGWSCKDTTTQVVVDSGDFWNPLYAAYSSPTDPNSVDGYYRPNMECTYSLGVAPQKWVVAYFYNVDMPLHCGQDWVTVDKPDPSTPFTLCGDDNPYDYMIVIQTNIGSFQFFSDASNEMTGFYGFMVETFSDKRRSPDGAVRVRREPEAKSPITLDNVRRNAKLFQSWIKHLQDVTNDISSRAAHIGAQDGLTDDQDGADSDANNNAVAVAGANDNNGGHDRVGSEEGYSVTKQSQRDKAEQYFSKEKVRAMISLSRVAVVGEVCGRDVHRMVSNLLDICVSHKD